MLKEDDKGGRCCPVISHEDSWRLWARPFFLLVDWQHPTNITNHAAGRITGIKGTRKHSKSLDKAPRATSRQGEGPEGEGQEGIR